MKISNSRTANASEPEVIEVGDFVKSEDGLPVGFVLERIRLPFGKEALPAVRIDTGGGRTDVLTMDEVELIAKREEADDGPQ